MLRGPVSSRFAAHDHDAGRAVERRTDMVNALIGDHTRHITHNASSPSKPFWTRIRRGDERI
ncbi:hypothetical protein C8Q70DRAFT_1041030 [Cubamyces menziesii]|nr:hypothetical protein C8Q70DRAFT_1041030 [Cubamyces menziesii]